MKRGKFITFEGGEGAGKSTQAKRLAERLERTGISVIVTREPGGTPVGEDVRELIMRDHPTDPVTELLLFAAARAEHVTSVIRPALDDGTWVISDRFMDSTRVYQGKLYGLEPEFIAQLERFTVAPDYPDLTLILDLPASAGIERAQLRGTLSRYDAERIETHETLREGFLEIADAEPLRCVLIDASLTVSSVETAVWQAVSSHLLAEAD
ncbi:MULTISPECIES: dTMP kinase [Hyphomicrobium]|uniref:Thymidylate kinase n=1 Tax=Hyphomicrobium facile TaxID=51670 RepID=A0A1I7NWC3_9HYPH|nr:MULTISPECIES: dTMP kinase [Hyphomicrobium]MBY0562484.1 dTMP kinase [Hyphomicrobium sp.]SFV38949.1 thymidylate kinase [Hyphomicrobium facile]